jgi:hypothetical protein
MTIEIELGVLAKLEKKAFFEGLILGIVCGLAIAAIIVMSGAR